MEFIIEKLEPSHVTLNGRDYPMLFSLRAAAKMEAELKTPYSQIVSELLQLHGEDEPEPPSMSWARQAVVVACLMQAGGVKVKADDLMELHVSQMQTLCNGAAREIFQKIPKGNQEKNA